MKALQKSPPRFHLFVATRPGSAGSVPGGRALWESPATAARPPPVARRRRRSPGSGPGAGRRGAPPPPPPEPGASYATACRHNNTVQKTRPRKSGRSKRRRIPRRTSAPHHHFGGVATPAACLTPLPSPPLDRSRARFVSCRRRAGGRACEAGPCRREASTALTDRPGMPPHHRLPSQQRGRGVAHPSSSPPRNPRLYRGGGNSTPSRK